MTNRNWIVDLKSGFFISLIAMPLCLGIAIASSFPPIAGIITAIVGGLIVSLVGGCNLSIKGPAAGLIVIVLASVMELGAGDAVLGYKRTLAVGVVAALLQIIFALLKTARFGRLMPPSVIHGMLAAIGVIIIAKQIHILVGAKPYGKTTFALMAEIPRSIMNINPELAIIGLITLILMFVLPLLPNKLLKSMPPALLALLVVVPLGLMWQLDMAHSYLFFNHSFNVGPDFLVNLPQSLVTSLVFPDFSVLSSPAAYKHVFLLALVGSIESVLTVIAVDSMSNQKVKSNLDRDLLGVGIGNLICSLIGGLPMISEVVRSKANIDSKATGRLSNFFHGAFLLLAISLLGPVIREIPLSALAAMLMIVGFRLASFRHFAHTYKIGSDQLILFLATFLTTLASDLLIGIVAGVLLKLVIHFIRGVKPSQLFNVLADINELPDRTKIEIKGPVIFTNYVRLQKQIVKSAFTSKNVEIDVSHASLLDHTVLSCLESLKSDLGDGKLTISGLDKLSCVSKHQLSTRRYA